MILELQNSNSVQVQWFELLKNFQVNSFIFFFSLFRNKKKTTTTRSAETKYNFNRDLFSYFCNLIIILIRIVASALCVLYFAQSSVNDLFGFFALLQAFGFNFLDLFSMLLNWFHLRFALGIHTTLVDLLQHLHGGWHLKEANKNLAIKNIKKSKKKITKPYFSLFLATNHGHTLLLNRIG